MRAVISITDVLALGDDLQAAGIPLKLHLRDACGGQSCWFEYLGEEDDPSKRETALTPCARACGAAALGWGHESGLLG